MGTVNLYESKIIDLVYEYARDHLSQLIEDIEQRVLSYLKKETYRYQGCVFIFYHKEYKHNIYMVEVRNQRFHPYDIYVYQGQVENYDDKGDREKREKLKYLKSWISMTRETFKSIFNPLECSLQLYSVYVNFYDDFNLNRDFCKPDNFLIYKGQISQRAIESISGLFYVPGCVKCLAGDVANIVLYQF